MLCIVSFIFVSACFSQYVISMTYSSFNSNAGNMTDDGASNLEESIDEFQENACVPLQRFTADVLQCVMNVSALNIRFKSLDELNL